MGRVEERSRPRGARNGLALLVGAFSRSMTVRSRITRGVVERAGAIEVDAPFDREPLRNSLATRSAADYAAIGALVPEQEGLGVGLLMIDAGAPAMQRLEKTETETEAKTEAKPSCLN